MRSVGPLFRRLNEATQHGGDCFFAAVPPELVQKALVSAERDKDRNGVKLPHWLVLRLVTCLFFLRGPNIPVVLDRVATFFGPFPSWRGRVPHSSSIAEARDRLGVPVVKCLFELFADWLTRKFDDYRWRGHVVVALDGTTLRTPDSPSNVAAFERHGGRNGSSGFPQVRLLALVSTVTHFVLGAAFGPCKGKGTGELSLADTIVPLVQAGWIVLMDRGFCSFPLLSRLSTANRLFFVRRPMGKTAARPKRIGPPIKKGKDWWVDYLPTSRNSAKTSPLRLRWIRIKVGTRKVEFLTNLDPKRFPYDALKDLYLQRWEVEFVFRELKVDLVGKKVPFRSQTPTRVEQEIYGLLIAYNAVRLRMAQAARKVKVQPRELSFTQSLFLTQLSMLNDLPLEPLLAILGTNLIAKRPRRRYDRVVKAPAARYAANRNRAKPG